MGLGICLSWSYPQDWEAQPVWELVWTDGQLSTLAVPPPRCSLLCDRGQVMDRVEFFSSKLWDH